PLAIELLSRGGMTRVKRPSDSTRGFGEASGDVITRDAGNPWTCTGIGSDSRSLNGASSLRAIDFKRERLTSAGSSSIQPISCDSLLQADRTESKSSNLLPRGKTLI